MNVDPADAYWAAFERALLKARPDWLECSDEVRAMGAMLWRTGFRMGWAEALAEAMLPEEE